MALRLNEEASHSMDSSVRSHCVAQASPGCPHSLRLIACPCIRPFLAPQSA